MSKYFKIIALSFLFILGSAQAETENSDEKNLTKTLEVMRQAMLDSNVEQLKVLISPSLSYGHTNGYLEDHDAFIEAMESGNAKYNDLKWTEQVITIDSDVAVVRNRMYSLYLNKGKPGEADIGVILVWKKNENNQWQLWARQAHNRLP